MVCECAFRKELEKAFEREASIDHVEKLLNELVARVEECHETLSVEKDYYSNTMMNLARAESSLREVRETLRKERRKRWLK